MTTLEEKAEALLQSVMKLPDRNQQLELYRAMTAPNGEGEALVERMWAIRQLAIMAGRILEGAAYDAVNKQYMALNGRQSLKSKLMGSVYG